MYGMDIYSKNEFIDYRSFKISRDYLNKKLFIKKAGYNSIVLLRNKLNFYCLLKQCNINTPEVFGVLYFSQNEIKYYKIPEFTEDKLENISNFPCFVKSIDGECGNGVKFVESTADIEKSHIYGTEILQKPVKQHKEINKLSPKCCNTIRIVTTCKNGNIDVFSAVLRCGVSSTGNVDNWSCGGIAIGIDSNGLLKKHGYYKPDFGTVTKQHPDTNIVFSGFKIPFYREAVELVKKAHYVLHQIPSIGWDVAITDNGPIIIEGNDNWEITLMQVCNKGLKNEWNHFANNWE